MFLLSDRWQTLRRDPRLVGPAGVALGVLLVALPFVTDWAVGRAWVRIAAFALLYVMLALGLNIVVGYAGLLDLGYVAFFAVGAYFYVLLAAPTLGLRGDYLAIVTLGFGEIIRIFLVNLNAPINITNGPQGVNLIDPVRLGDFSLAQTHALLGAAFPDVY